MLVALLPLLALGMSERVQNYQEEKEPTRYIVHQEDDFRAPDFDLSQLKVGGMNFQIYFGLSKVLFSGTAEVPGCPEEHQHLTVYEWALLSFGCNDFHPRYLYEDALGKTAKTNLTHVTWEDIVTEVNLAIPLQENIIKALCLIRPSMDKKIPSPSPYDLAWTVCSRLSLTLTLTQCHVQSYVHESPYHPLVFSSFMVAILSKREIIVGWSWAGEDH